MFDKNSSKSLMHVSAAFGSADACSRTWQDSASNREYSAAGEFLVLSCRGESENGRINRIYSTTRATPSCSAAPWTAVRTAAPKPRRRRDSQAFVKMRCRQRHVNLTFFEAESVAPAVVSGLQQVVRGTLRIRHRDRHFGLECVSDGIPCLAPVFGRNGPR